MTGSEIETLLLRNELALLDPAIRRDRSCLLSLLAEDFLEFGASGLTWTRERIIELLATEEYEPPIIEDFQCRMVAPRVALVTYRAVRIDPASRARSAILRSTLWTEEAGEWLARFHQGTPAEA
jgi:glyoxylase I family protein